MRQIFALVAVFVIILCATPHAQKPVVAKASETDGLAMLTVSDPLFEGMCKSFAKPLAVPKGPDTLLLVPKPEEDSDQGEGDVWIVSVMTREMSVSYQKLPHEFLGLRGSIARKVVGMVCYLENEEFYSRKQVSIVANIADIEVIAKAFR